MRKEQLPIVIVSAALISMLLLGIAVVTLI